MVKIKDFTLASQNLGWQVPPVPYTPGAHAFTRINLSEETSFCSVEFLAFIRIRGLKCARSLGLKKIFPEQAIFAGSVLYRHSAFVSHFMACVWQSNEEYSTVRTRI